MTEPSRPFVDRIGPHPVLEVLHRSSMAWLLRIRYGTVDAAVKTWSGMSMADLDTRQRFKREIDLQMQIHHPNVCEVLDWGYLDNGTPYLVLELLEGKPLAGPVDIPTAAALLRQATGGTAAIHAAGIMHRDLRPSNLFVTTEGVVKIMGFGLSRRFTPETLTPAGVSLGEVPYVSPEQLFDARNVDRRTDLFSLGVVGYELLTGRVPFSGRSLGEVMSRLTSGTYDPLGPEVPPALAQWLDTMLATDRKRRFADGAEALAAFPSLS